MASQSYATADTGLREVADAINQAVQRLSQAKSQISTVKAQLDNIPTKYGDVVTFVNTNQAIYPDLKTRLDALSADFQARSTTAGNMETALVGIDV